MILISPKGDKLRYVLQMNFKKAYNNEAEYEGLLHGMRMAKACGATRLMIYGDSNLVVQQTMKACDAISENMAAYRDLYNMLEGSFNGCELCHIGRGSNEEADTLANIGSNCAPVPPGVFLEQISTRSIKYTDPDAPAAAAPAVSSELAAIVDDDASAGTKANAYEVFLVEPSWTQPYIAYLLRKKLPEDEVEARRITRRSNAFITVKCELYKKSASGILQRCVEPEEGRRILLDIHEGICEHHASRRALAAKTRRAGFYWLSIM